MATAAVWSHASSERGKTAARRRIHRTHSHKWSEKMRHGPEDVCPVHSRNERFRQFRRRSRSRRQGRARGSVCAGDCCCSSLKDGISTTVQVAAGRYGQRDGCSRAGHGLRVRFSPRCSRNRDVVCWHERCCKCCLLQLPLLLALGVLLLSIMIVHGRLRSLLCRSSPRGPLPARRLVQGECVCWCALSTGLAGSARRTATLCLAILQTSPVRPPCCCSSTLRIRPVRLPLYIAMLRRGERRSSASRPGAADLKPL